MLMGVIARALDRLSSEDGATSIEYALMVALIAMAIIAAATFLGQSTDLLYQEVGSSIST